MIPRGPSPEERRHMLTTPEMYAPMMDFEREREEQAYLDQDMRHAQHLAASMDAVFNAMFPNQNPNTGPSRGQEVQSD